MNSYTQLHTVMGFMNKGTSWKEGQKQNCEGSQDKVLAVQYGANSWYIHICTWHRLCTILTLLTSVGGGGDGGVRGKKSGKPLTAVQACVSAYVKGTVDICRYVGICRYFNEKSGNLQQCLCGDKTGYFWREVVTFFATFVVTIRSSSVVFLCQKNRHFKPKHDLSLT